MSLDKNITDSILDQIKKVDEDISNNVDWVYIGTPISSHYNLCKKYLKKGKSIICEKPLTQNYMKTKELCDLAESLNLRLHEVCIYKNHKQFHHMVNSLDKKQSSLRSACFKFKIPHLNPKDIRYNKKKGGGALLDLGYYPISIILSIFGYPKKITSTSFSEKGYEVDLSGAAIFKYEKFYCIAEWGIGMPYENTATIVFTDSRETYDRIFSKPLSLNTSVLIEDGFSANDIAIGHDDQICNMFRDIFNGKYKHDTSNVLDIAQSMDSVYSVLKKGEVEF